MCFEYFCYMCLRVRSLRNPSPPRKPSLGLSPGRIDKPGKHKGALKITYFIRKTTYSNTKFDITDPNKWRS